MIGLEHLEEHKALSLRTSVAFVCELPDAVKYQMANELNEGAIGIRFYQQSRQLEILSIAVYSEHLYADERNVNAAMLAGLLEHFLAQMHKAVKSVDTMFVNLNKVSEDLEQLSEEHPLPAAILKVRQLGKIQNTYISKILPEIDRDGRIRTNFNLIFTTSGRLSSSGKFNAQQIPRDNPIIKGCIKAIEGYKIVSQDLTTAEMYYAAVLSGDKNLQQVFSSGGDFHSTIAKMVFSLPCAVEDVKKLYGSMRQSAKAISFGILYGSGANKVSQTVSKATGQPYPVEQAREDIKAYFNKFSKLKKWLNERKTFIETNGYTYSFFGRKRRLPNVFSSDKGIAAHEVRSGINAEVQSLASDINLLGAMATANEIKAKGLDAKIFMLVHDSVVALVKDECVEQYCEILKRNTQQKWGCEILETPIGVDQDIGDDYSFGHFDEVYGVTGDNMARI
jgi:DNA polymerase I-like protein with 3'-5' exonuclease and polymerase domains